MEKLRLNFEEFCEYVQSNILDYVDAPDDAKAEIREVVKRNDEVLHGLTILTSKNCITPVIYLDELYVKHFDREVTQEYLEWTLKNIASEYDFGMSDAIDPKNIDLSYENIKDKIEMQVLDKSINKERANQMLTYPLDNGFYGMFYIVIKDGKSGRMAAPITKELAASMNYDAISLFKDAERYMELKNPATFTDMESMMLSIMQGEVSKTYLSEIDHLETGSDMYVLSNDSKVDGASVLWLGDTKAKIGAALGENYYVLPSSVHELIIVPVSMGTKPAELEKMVKDVNATMVDKKDVLSDKVLYYDKARDKLRLAEGRDRDQRQPREEAR